MKMVVPVRFVAPRALYAGFSPALRPLRADLSRKSASRQVKVCQGECNEGAIGVLRQTSIAHFRETPQPFDHGEHMFDAGADLRLVAVLAARHVINAVFATRSLIREVASLRGFAADQRFLACIRAVAIDALLLPMQKLWQWVLVVHVGRRDDCAMRQSALTIHADMNLHAEIPLLAFARLMHFRGFVTLEGREGNAGRGDQLLKKR
ncbi:hypothetical protein QF000_008015 [Paraburkholderia atlantica]